MEPLDLRLQQPRSPRAQLAGIIFSARAVDKIRASLPGGNLNGYFTGIGMSVVWAHYTKIDLAELTEVVRNAQSENEVEAWIAVRTAKLDKDRVNAKLLSMETTRIPEAWKAAFDDAYPPELREQHRFVFDLIEADDARLTRCAS